nr:GerAB/ArcD/ProY family transporter [Brevibacillus massiliensis]
MKFQNQLPVFTDTGFRRMVHASLYFISIFSMTIVILMMVFPVSVAQLKQGKKAFYIGLLTGGLVLIVMIVLTITVLGAEVAARHHFPSYVLAKKIRVSNKNKTGLDLFLAELSL